MPYRLDETTGQIDYDQMEKSADLFRPKLIVAGASAYSRLIDYERIRKIADGVGAYVSTLRTFVMITWQHCCCCIRLANLIRISV